MDYSRKILFKGDTITVVMHQDPHFVEMIFYGYTQSEEYRSAWNSLLPIKNGKEFNFSWVIDMEYMHAQPEDLEWAYQTWFPQALKQFSAKGRVAIVPPVNFVGNFKVSRDSKQIQQQYPNIQINFFKTFDDAKAWLLN